MSCLYYLFLKIFLTSILNPVDSFLLYCISARTNLSLCHRKQPLLCLQAVATSSFHLLNPNSSFFLLVRSSRSLIFLASNGILHQPIILCKFMLVTVHLWQVYHEYENISSEIRTAFHYLILILFSRCYVRVYIGMCTSVLRCIYERMDNRMGTCFSNCF